MKELYRGFIAIYNDLIAVYLVFYMPDSHRFALFKNIILYFFYLVVY